MSGTAFPELLHLSNIAVMFCATVFVQTTVIIGAGFCLAYSLRRRGAATQSITLRAILAAVFLCPLVVLFFPSAGFHGITFELPQAAYHSPASPIHSKIKVSAPSSGKIQPFTNSPHSPVPLNPLPHQAGEQQNLLPAGNPGSIVQVPSPERSMVQNSTGLLSKIKDANVFPVSYNVRTCIYLLVTVLWAAVSLFLLVRLGAFTVYIQYLRRNTKLRSIK
jgi:hypothetical protein